MGWVLVALWTIALLCLMGVMLSYIDGIRHENRLMESQLEMEQLYDEELRTRMEAVRRFRHDASGLIRALEFSQGGGLVRAVVDLKRFQCEQADIAFSCEADDEVLARCGALGDDLVAVVQNLLENAYEASLLVEPASERVVELRVAKLGDSGVSLTVANRTASDEMPTFRTSKPDAANHGLGLQTVNEIVERHGGERRVLFDPATRMLETCVGLPSGASL